jgi:hypothetical protein
VFVGNFAYVSSIFSNDFLVLQTSFEQYISVAMHLGLDVLSDG